MPKTITKDVLTRETLGGSINDHDVQIEILPKLGANLVSFVVDGKELIYWSEKDLLEEGEQRGCFHMFPTPCRLPDAKYTFQGKTYTQTKHGEKVIIHGLFRDEPMQIKKGTNALTATLSVTARHPVHEGYPFPCIFSLTYMLIEAGIQIGFSYENTGRKDAPFGYGLHPFWKISGSRKDTAIRVPCEYLMELENLVPTGKIVPVKDKLDLRQTTSLEGVDIDNLFWKRDLTVPALVEYRNESKALVLEASELFNHMIAYAPGGKPFVCVEFLTCAPNQINLYKGPENDVSGLIIVPPRGRIEGWVRYALRGL
jgi:aldose 1-epimerase